MLLFSTVNLSAQSSLKMPIKAVAILAGDSSVKGKIYFEQSGPGQPVKITGELNGLTPGKNSRSLSSFILVILLCMSVESFSRIYIHFPEPGSFSGDHGFHIQ